MLADLSVGYNRENDEESHLKPAAIHRRKQEWFAGAPVWISARPFYGGYNVAAKDALKSGGCCSVLSKDVRNEFNSANWSRIEGMLADIGGPGYLASLVDNCLSERTAAVLLYHFEYIFVHLLLSFFVIDVKTKTTLTKH